MSLLQRLRVPVMTGKYGCRVDVASRIGEYVWPCQGGEAAVLQVENDPGRDKTAAVRRGKNCLEGIRWQRSDEVKTVMRG